VKRPDDTDESTRTVQGIALAVLLAAPLWRLLLNWLV
jgi:hypothetical protein